MGERISRDKIMVSERSLTDENLKLIGFGCGSENCDWQFEANSISNYSKALRLHGQHNSEKHIHASKITWIYRQFKN